MFGLLVLYGISIVVSYIMTAAFWDIKLNWGFINYEKFNTKRNRLLSLFAPLVLVSQTIFIALFFNMIYNKFKTFLNNGKSEEVSLHNNYWPSHEGAEERPTFQEWQQLKAELYLAKDNIRQLEKRNGDLMVKLKDLPKSTILSKLVDERLIKLRPKGRLVK